MTDLGPAFIGNGSAPSGPSGSLLPLGKMQLAVADYGR